MPDLESRFASLYESDDESDDETLESDDEATAEFLPGLIGGLIPGVGGAISGLLGGRRRSPLPRVMHTPIGSGVQTATLAVPGGGAATIRLPAEVVTQNQFRETTQKLEEAINRNTTRLNTTQSDIQNLTQRVGTVVANTRRDLARAQKEQRIALAKLRKNQQSQATTSMLIGLMSQRQQQRQLASHTHPIATPGTSTETGAPAIADGDNTMLLLLPMMMMGTPDAGPGGDNTMMMMMMVLMLGK